MMKKENPKEENIKIVTTNRRARRDYHIMESLETGIELKGTEVKSLRESRANLKDSFARIEKNEVVLYNLHISPYSHTSERDLEPDRARRLLLHKNEIRKLKTKTMERGFTLIPLKIYFIHGLAKVEIALAKGKRSYDRREHIKKRDAEKEMMRARKA